MNTTGVDPLKERLTTTTIESSWFDRQSPATCVPVFSDGGSIRVAFDLRVPRAFKLNETFNGCAVYISLSVYLKSLPVDTSESHFIWYSTNVFDFERDHGIACDLFLSTTCLFVSTTVSLY